MCRPELGHNNVWFGPPDVSNDKLLKFDLKNCDMNLCLVQHSAKQYTTVKHNAVENSTI